MENAMLGGEAEPYGMDFGPGYEDYEYGDEEDDQRREMYMGGNKERKMSELKVPDGEKKRNRHSHDDENGNQNFPLGNHMDDLSQDEYESQLFSMVQKQNSSHLMKDNVISSNTEFMNLDNLPDII